MSGSPLHTRIWREEAEPDNPFATRRAWCHGYDVYGDMLGRASWMDMLYLLIKGEPPTPAQHRFLDALGVAMANAGPRDPMVHAAMCGGIGGTPAAAALMAALSVGAGQSGGSRDVYLGMKAWARCHAADPNAWPDILTACQPIAWPDLDDCGWPEIEHPAGFEPLGVGASGIVQTTLSHLASISPGNKLKWLEMHRAELEQRAGLPLGMAGVAAAALSDMGFSPAQGEMLHLMLRLPGAAAHALEQASYGFKQFPFPDVDLQDDPLQRHKDPA
jgi:citrate synthase